MNRSTLSTILEGALKGIAPTRAEITSLLSLTNESDIRRVTEAARTAREIHFGDKVFLYGFVYGSTYCRNHCNFCFYRASNTKSPRYRKTVDQVVEIAEMLADSGVHLIDLTFGEDSRMREADGYAGLLEMVERVKTRTGRAVMVSPGVVPDPIIRSMARKGADWYALYQETHNPVMYAGLRTRQGFAERCGKRRTAAAVGMLVEDGMLLGVGETVRDRALTIEAMKASGADQVRVMSFVPQEETPLSHLAPPHRRNEYLVIAVMRLLMPDRLIPASLDVDGIKGLAARLAAGANVVTSIIPPKSALAGVSQSALDIEEGLRSVPEVRRILKVMGLTPAANEDYDAWMAGRRELRPENAEERRAAAR